MEAAGMWKSATPLPSTQSHFPTSLGNPLPTPTPSPRDYHSSHSLDDGEE